MYKATFYQIYKQILQVVFFLLKIFKISGQNYRQNWQNSYGKYPVQFLSQHGIIMGENYIFQYSIYTWFYFAIGTE